MIDHQSYVRPGAIEVVEGDNPRLFDKAFVFFSGRQFNRGMFHFAVSAVKAGRPYVCVRDASNRWYNTENYADTAAELRAWMEGRDKVVFVGSSMGATAALKVIAFAAQNPVDAIGRDLVAEYRAAARIPETHLYYCTRSEDPMDVALAEGMRGINGFHLRGRDCDTHRVMDLMNISGELLQLLEVA
jgi:pimeloyl-ACP methyl ester carboxylesterase